MRCLSLLEAKRVSSFFVIGKLPFVVTTEYPSYTVLWMQTWFSEQKAVFRNEAAWFMKTFYALSSLALTSSSKLASVCSRTENGGRHAGLSLKHAFITSQRGEGRSAGMGRRWHCTPTAKMIWSGAIVVNKKWESMHRSGLFACCNSLQTLYIDHASLPNSFLFCLTTLQTCTCIGWSSSLHGCSPVSNSHSSTPKAYWSTFSLVRRPSNCSGACSGIKWKRPKDDLCCTQERQTRAKHWSISLEALLLLKETNKPC